MKPLRWLFSRPMRALAGFAGAFVGGWLVENAWHPKPLISELWRKAQRQQSVYSGSLKPGPAATSISALTPEQLAAQQAIGFSLEALMNLNEPYEQLARLDEFLKNASSEQIAALAPELAKIQHPLIRSTAVAQLFTAWAQKDVASALAAAKGMGEMATSCQTTVWRTWAKLNPDGAIAEAKESGAWDEFSYALMEGITDADPLKALQAFDKLTDADHRSWKFGDFERMVRNAAQADIAGTLVAIAKFPEGHFRDASLLSSLTEPLLAFGFDNAMEEISKVPSAKLRDALTATALGQLVKTDATKAIAALRALPKGANRDMALDSVVQTLSQTDALQSLRLVKELYSEGQLPPNIENLIRFKPTLSAAEAQAFLAEVPDGPQRLPTINAVISSLGKNKAEALAWYRSQSIEDLPPEALKQAGKFIPSQEWQGYLDQVEKLSPEQRESAYRQYGKEAVGQIIATSQSAEERAQALAKLDPRLQASAALELAVRTGSKNRNGIIYAEIDETGRSSQRSRSAGLTYDEMKETYQHLTPEAQEIAALPLAVRLAESDPQTASELVRQQINGTEDDATAAAAERITLGWMKKDSLAASAWVGTLPAGEVRDAAVVALIRETLKFDAPAAEVWAGTLTDPLSKLQAERLLHPNTQPQP